MKTILGNPKLKNQKLNYTFEPTVYHFIKNMQIVWLHCSKNESPSMLDNQVITFSILFKECHLEIYVYHEIQGTLQKTVIVKRRNLKHHFLRHIHYRQKKKLSIQNKQTQEPSDPNTAILRRIIGKNLSICTYNPLLHIK